MAMSGLFWLGENVTAASTGGLLTKNQPSLAKSSFYKYQPVQILQMCYPCGKSHVGNEGKNVRDSEIQEGQQGLKHAQKSL
jgi:hypothetical protein